MRAIIDEHVIDPLLRVPNSSHGCEQARAEPHNPYAGSRTVPSEGADRHGHKHRDQVGDDLLGAEQ